MNLSGNQFGEKGLITVFRGLSAAKSLSKIMLSDCGWRDTKEVMDAMAVSFQNNTTLLRYDLKYNSLSEESVNRLATELIPSGKHIVDVELSVVIPEELREQFQKALAANKPGKKGKKGKKK